MTTGKQNASGRAFEYRLALAFRKITKATVNESALLALHRHYESRDNNEKSKIDRAADAAARFIADVDSGIRTATHIELPADSVAQSGDVRDIILSNEKTTVGVSAKNRHHALKHSRLSDEIDFGQQWADCPVSNKYWKAIRPVFSFLRQIKKDSSGEAVFRDVPNKAGSIYLPILSAFEDELQRLCEEHREVFARRLFRYLLGEYDHYKITKENGAVSVLSVNIGGNLEWGRRWRIPERVENISRNRGSTSTLRVSFAGGWQLSFRLHNATSRVEPSLKFDVQFISWPPNVAKQEIHLP